MGLKNLGDKLRLLHRQYCIVTVSIVMVDDYEILCIQQIWILVINVTIFNISVVTILLQKYKSANKNGNNC